MIEITRTQVTGWETAVHGMRNPLNSWGKSDTPWGISQRLKLGDNDLALMKKLVAAGNDHSKFMRYIVVTCDIKAPRYMLVELDTYKIGTVSNSCSLMHTAHKRDFTVNDFSHDSLDDDESLIDYLFPIIDAVNTCRKQFVETGDKKYWRRMIQLLPQSYNQLRTMQFNYAVLRNIYHARKNHKLTEWKTFCEWIESLPYSEFITM